MILPVSKVHSSEGHVLHLILLIWLLLTLLNWKLLKMGATRSDTYLGVWQSEDREEKRYL